ncbi:MAG TPA: FAD-dependent monooxygenase [Acidimicrobiia bacterium]
MDKRFDVLVVGSGPAGSIAALVLARGGARVALVGSAPRSRRARSSSTAAPTNPSAMTVGLNGFSLSSTTRVRADVIVGADGATSRVAEVVRLVDPAGCSGSRSCRALLQVTSRLSATA